MNQGRQADRVVEVPDEDNEIQNDEPSNTQEDSSKTQNDPSDTLDKSPDKEEKDDSSDKKVEEAPVHQKPDEAPPGGARTLTELRLGEFRTDWSSKSGVCG